MDLYEALSRIDARERLFKLNLADYPNMEKTSRKDFFKGIKDRAGYEQKIMTAQEVAEVLNNG